jgi:hypothetical protein
MLLCQNDRFTSSSSEQMRHPAEVQQCGVDWHG